MGIHVVQYIEKAVRSDVFRTKELVIQLRILFTDNLGQVIVVLLSDVCFIPYIHDLIHFGDELLHELQVLVQVYTGLH